jgi:iron complex transport system substrate-binding protein
VIKEEFSLVNFLGLIALIYLSSACTQTGNAVEAALPDASATPSAVVVTDAEGLPVTIEDTSRLVTLGGSVTEIVFALGAGDKVVGVDSSSVYPEEATQLPQVGYQRQLAAEGVLALNPTLILATTEAGPPEAIVQLKDSGVTVLILPAEESVEGAKAKIRGLAQALSLADKGEALIQKMEAELAEAERLQAQVNSKPKVIFIYARGPGAVNVAGVETAADAMIRLAGGVNAVQDYEGYKPLTAEAAVAATPDVLLLLSRGLESLGGQEALLKQPGLAQTPAGQNGRVIAMDDLSYERVRNQVFSEKPGF